jgi:hypothetical protein
MLNPGAPGYASAQETDSKGNPVSVEVEIIDNGPDVPKVVKRSESHGTYSIATVSRSLD